MGLNVGGGGGGLAQAAVHKQITRATEKGRGWMIPNNDYVGAATSMELGGLMNTVAFTDATGRNAMDEYGVYFEQDFSTVSGADQGWYEQVDKTRLDHKPFFSHTFLLPAAVTNLRMFVGLADITALGDVSDADDFTVSGIGLQYSTGRADTTFQFLEDDGTTQNITDSTVTVAANTLYTFEVDAASSTSVVVRIRNADGTVAASATLSTNLPGATVGLRPVFLINPQAAQLHQLRNYKGALETRAYGIA